MRAAVFAGPHTIEVIDRPDLVVAAPADGGRGEAVRVPFAGSTLARGPRLRSVDQVMCSLLTLTDIMCTGHHAAVMAGVRPGHVVAVVGDGAVGLPITEDVPIYTSPITPLDLRRRPMP